MEEEGHVQMHQCTISEHSLYVVAWKIYNVLGVFVGGGNFPKELVLELTRLLEANNSIVKMIPGHVTTLQIIK